MNSDLIHLFYWLTGVGILFWIFAALFIAVSRMVMGQKPPEAARTIFHELRPFYLLMVAGNATAANLLWGPDPGTYITLGIEVSAWFYYRNIDDDDRWKRRRRRLTERVAEFGGRLAVVPS